MKPPSPSHRRPAFAGAFIDPPKEIAVSGDGTVRLGGAALTLFRWFEEHFRELALECGAAERRFPNLIERRTLEQADYFGSFPHGATAVQAPHAPVTHVLQPAVCYQCYRMLEGQTLTQPMILTCQGTCFRHEDGHFSPPGRLWEFTMREVVFIGPPDWVREQRQSWIAKIRAVVDSLDLVGRIEPASDPFIGGNARGRKILQKLKELKFELNLEMPESRTRVAAASFNLHETFFTDRFKICFKGRQPCVSGCVAFGLERWLLAYLGQHGLGSPSGLRQLKTPTP